MYTCIKKFEKIRFSFSVELLACQLNISCSWILLRNNRYYVFSLLSTWEPAISSALASTVYQTLVKLPRLSINTVPPGYPAALSQAAAPEIHTHIHRQSPLLEAPQAAAPRTRIPNVPGKAEPAWLWCSGTSIQALVLLFAIHQQQDPFV